MVEVASIFDVMLTDGESEYLPWCYEAQHNSCQNTKNGLPDFIMNRGKIMEWRFRDFDVLEQKTRGSEKSHETIKTRSDHFRSINREIATFIVFGDMDTFCSKTVETQLFPF